jgi:hypothetical protein
MVFLLTLITPGIFVTSGENTYAEANVSTDASVIFRLDGDFFTPSSGNEIKTWDIPVPNDRAFKKVVVELDVTLGRWWANNPDGVHNLFWFTRQGTWRSNTIGYVNLFGPGQNKLKQMTNLELAKGQAQSMTAAFTAQNGHTYHITYTYDCLAGHITTVLMEGGTQKAFVQMKATASEIKTKGGFYQLWIGLHEKYNESPTVGWTYSNLYIKLDPDEVIEKSYARGPLTVHSANPRYFDDGTGRAVLLVGVNHGWELQDDAWATRYVLDWTAFLEYLEQYNLNYIRMWRVESTTSSDNPSFLTTPMPYQRTGPENAIDGRPKFDLNQFNQAYFDRIRQRCVEAGKRGIYVTIMFFERHSSFNQRDAGGMEYPWKTHPFHPANNVNGLNPDIDGDGCPREMHQLAQKSYTTQQFQIAKQVLNFQKAYVRKVIDTVNDLDNVLFEVCNEALQDTKTDNWQRHMVDFIKDYEAGKHKQHLVGFTGPSMEHKGDPWPEFKDQFASNADFISPRDADAYRTNPPKANGAKIIFADSDHIAPYRRDNVWVWKCFTRGLHPQALEAYDIIAPNPPRIDPARDKLVRQSLGYCLDYANRMDLVSMSPQNTLASTTYCLANPGSEYLAFAPSGGTFTIDLSAATGTLNVKWLNVKTGAYRNGGTMNGGAYRSFTASFTGPAVVHIKKADLSEK